MILHTQYVKFINNSKPAAILSLNISVISANAPLGTKALASVPLSRHGALTPGQQKTIDITEGTIKQFELLEECILR